MVTLGDNQNSTQFTITNWDDQGPVKYIDMDFTFSIQYENRSNITRNSSLMKSPIDMFSFFMFKTPQTGTFQKMKVALHGRNNELSYAVSKTSI